MPNNIRDLKRELQKRITGEGTKGDASSILGKQQRLVAAVVLNNLLRFTNVDTGELAGGWIVRSRGDGANKRPTKNKSRLTRKSSFVSAQRWRNIVRPC